MRTLPEAFDSWKASPGAATLVPLLESSRPVVHLLCYQVLRHAQDAEDATQAVLLQLLDRLAQIRDARHLRAFLHQTSFHVALNLKRSRKRRTDHERTRAAQADAVAPAGDDAADAVHLHLAELDDDARTLVVGRYFERRSIQELADDAGCSTVTLGKRLEKARERLLQALSRSGIAMTAPGLDAFFGGVATVAVPTGPLSAAVLSKASSAGAIAVKTKAGLGVLLVACAGIGLLLVAAFRPRPSSPSDPELTARVDRQSVDSKATATPPAPLPSPAPARVVVRAGGALRQPCTSAVLSSIVAFMKVQNADGSWGDGPAYLDGRALDSVGVTALTLLTFLGAGYSQLSKDEYDGYEAGKAVRSALKWLLSRQRPDGTFITTGEERINQALAGLALSEAYGMTASHPLKEPARQAFDAMMSMQQADGSWGDPTTSLWAAEALHSARLAEFIMDSEALKRAQNYYRSKLDAGPDLPALIGHLFASRDVTHPGVARTSASIRAVQPQASRPEYLYWYMGSLGLFHTSGAEGAAWKEWNEPFKQALLFCQQKDGLWPASTTSGTLVQSSLSTLALQVYYRYANVIGGTSLSDKR